MKQVFLFIVALPLITHAQGGKQKKTNPDVFQVQESVYKSAVSRFDLEVATAALYQMMAIRPERTDLNDSLCRTYYKRRFYYQANILAEEILRSNPENTDILEIGAISKEELGDYLESLNRFEYLYSLKKRLGTLYKIASLQYFLKRIGECEENINKILQDPAAKTETVPISSGTKGDAFQQVPVAAAALNIRGVILMEMNKPEEAKTYFEKSLEYMPDYKMARNNLNYLQRSASQGN